MEIDILANPVYDVERFGAYCRISSSCRCAGRNRSRDCEHGASLKDVYKTTADPKIVIALGDCAVVNCGMFKRQLCGDGAGRPPYSR